MKKLIALILSLLCVGSAVAQQKEDYDIYKMEGFGSFTVYLRNYAQTAPNMQSGTYVSNDKALSIDKVSFHIMDDKYCEESFEIDFYSAPVAKSNMEMWTAVDVHKINSKPIELHGKKGGGVVEYDISSHGVVVQGPYIVLISPTKESADNMQRNYDSYVGERGGAVILNHVVTKGMEYCGPTFYMVESLPTSPYAYIIAMRDVSYILLAHGAFGKNLPKEMLYPYVKVTASPASGEISKDLQSDPPSGGGSRGDSGGGSGGDSGGGSGGGSGGDSGGGSGGGSGGSSEGDSGGVVKDNSEGENEDAAPDVVKSAGKSLVVEGVEWSAVNVSEVVGVFVDNPEQAGGFYSKQDAPSACPQGWRLPTEEEAKNLAKHSGYWPLNLLGNFTDIDGWQAGYNGETAGRFFGANARVPMENKLAAEGILFFPVAGYIDNANGLTQSRVRGYYWLVQPDGADAQRNYHFYFGDTMVSPNEKERGDVKYLVRCVRNVAL